MEAFKNFKLALGTDSATAYTCPAATTAIVLMLQVCNVDGVNEADSTVTWTDASDSGASTALVSTAPVPAGSALGVLSGKLVLEAGDAIAGQASAAGDLVLTGSVVEMT